MKRSEMIRHLAYILEGPDYDTPEEMAEDVLDRIESYDMLPPLVKGTCECNTYQECPYHNREKYERFYKWEQE